MLIGVCEEGLISLCVYVCVENRFVSKDKGYNLHAACHSSDGAPNGEYVYNYKALPLDGDPPFFLFTPFFLAIKMLAITACLAMLAVV